MSKREVIRTPQTTLRQSVDFTLRKSETYSPIARNIFSMIHFQINKTGSKYFLIRKTDIETITGEITCTNDIKAGLDQLHNTHIYINDIKLTVGLISSWQQIDGDLFEVTMDDKLLVYFINVLNKYTEYVLEEMTTLKKKYSKRIYEILSGFSKQGTCVLSLEKFKEYLFIKNLETDKDSYPLWYDFERKVLIPAVDEINSGTTLNVSYRPKKTGRKVNAILFEFHEQRTTDPQLALEFDTEISKKNHLDLLQRQYHLRKDQALKFLREYDFEEKREELFALYCRSISPNDPRYISNLGAYIVKSYNLD